MSKAMQLKAKIRNLAQNNHVPAQAVLQNFMLERLLERISLSKYKDMVILTLKKVEIGFQVIGLVDLGFLEVDKRYWS